MKKKPIIRLLPGVMILLLALTIGGSVGTVLGKFVFSEDVATLSLTVKFPEVNNVITLDTTDVQNISVEQLDMRETTTMSTVQNYALLLTADTGYSLPESFTVTIGEAIYTVYTTAEENVIEGQHSVKDNPYGLEYDASSNILYIFGALIPKGNCTISISAAANPEVDEEEIEGATTEPVTDPSELEEEVTEPMTEPTEPEEEATEPVTEPSEPEKETTELVTEPSEPEKETTELVTEPSEPEKETTELVTEPSEPEEETIEPVSGPSEPEEETIEPVSGPSEPEEETTEPVTEPLDPENEIIEPMT